MGYSLRVQQLLRERGWEKAKRRAAEEAERARIAAEYHARFLKLDRAAAFLKISTAKLRRMVTAGTAPLSLKRGTHKQAPVVWPIEELQAFKADPANYAQTRAERLAALATVDAPTPPR